MNKRYWKSILLVILVVPFVTSCASYFKRKQCEKTNWFAHGEKVAMAGKRIDADMFVNECKKVEAEINEMNLDLGFKKGMASYCTRDGAYDTGRKGDRFTLDMCDDNRWKSLKKHHSRGVAKFCGPKSGYQAGARGWIYNNICPKNLEDKFLAKYNKGRGVFLRGEITDRQDKLKSLDRKIMETRLEKSEKSHRLTRLESSINFRRHSRSVGKKQVAPETPEEKEMKSDLRRQISDSSYKITKFKREVESIRKQISDLKKELRVLPRS